MNVSATGTYRFEARVANVGTGAKFRIGVDGVDRTGLVDVPHTGGWQVWKTVVVPGIQLTTGQHLVRVYLATLATSGGVGNYNWFRFAEEEPAPVPSPAYGGTPVALPGVVQAENFDEGGQGIAYVDSSGHNSGGVYRSTAVDIGHTSDLESGGYYVGWTRVGEWLRYSANVTQTRTYELEIRVANEGAGATFRIEVDGVDRTGPLAVPNTGGWDAWQTITVSGIPLTQGQRTVRLVMLTRNVENAGVGNFGFLRFH